ncbi:MAG TPA: dephospho-CoA kinase [Alphaproteobacteria bacterium]|nr:dephospho-CoA kinase [Alphaproteobacteria bacterium]
MRVLGLTGSIAMGKSTAAAMLRRMGVPVLDSDAIVHELTRPGGAAIPAITTAFPEIAAGAGIDRRALSQRAFDDPEVLRELERILHPMVRAAQARFLRLQRARGRRLVVLDVPLLYETGGEAACDTVAVVSAPRLVQMERVLSRPHMSLRKMHGIEARQMPDVEKRRRADFVIPTGLGRRPTWVALKKAVRRTLR